MVWKILKQLGKEKITFTEIEPQEYIKFLDNYSTCATMDEKSWVSNNPLCAYTKNTCQLILPLRGTFENYNTFYTNFTIITLMI